MDKEPETEVAPRARVTRVSIDRLYNLGNYEHIKYSIGIEIPEGADVLESVSKLRQVLRALKPLKAEGYTEKKARQIVDMTPEEREQAVKDTRISMEDTVAAPILVGRLDARKARRERALQLFNNLSGQDVYTDHKEQWDDNYDDEY